MTHSYFSMRFKSRLFESHTIIPLRKAFKKNFCIAEKSLKESVEKSLLSWYGHVGRIDEEGLGKKLS